jgi:hypothetical protein
MSGVAFPKGAEIRDDYGNLVATLTDDVMFGQIMAPNHFTPAEGSEWPEGQVPEAVTRFMDFLSILWVRDNAPEA